MHTKYGEELAYILGELAQPPLDQKLQAPYKKVLLSKFLRLGTSLGFYFLSSTLKSSFWLLGFPASCLVPLLHPTL